MKSFDPCYFREQFPLLSTIDKAASEISSLVYFDNAATTQKPLTVINSQQDFYQQINANVHRASHQLSAKATLQFEQSRQLAQNFINAASIKEIIWTKGATESINIVCQSLARDVLSKGDEIVICASEHHANIVPWQQVAKQTGANIHVLPLTDSGYIDISQLDKVITQNTKFVACAHISNVLGRINPVEQVIEKAKSVGALTLIDGAQAVAHINVDVQQLDCDFYVFSAHKMYGPTGIGLLYGKQCLLEKMSPYQSGGEMIKTVSFNKPTTFNSLPFKFEAGTPNIAGVIGFGASIAFLKPLLTNQDKKYQLFEAKLKHYCFLQLRDIEQVEFLVSGEPDIGVIAFTIKGHHNHDIATALDTYGIAVRSGHHCAMPLMETLKLDGCLRVSLAPYNTIAEIDFFINTLKGILSGETLDDNNTVNAVDLKDIHLEGNSSKPTELAKIITLFSSTKGWDSRHREIMLLGKTLPRLEKTDRDEHSLIAGCESKAWLKSSMDKQGNYSFVADSDAKVIRGLLVIVLAAFNHKPAKEIAEFDVSAYFKQLGLLQHLSPSRGNGLLAIVDKIKELTSPSE